MKGPAFKPNTFLSPKNTTYSSEQVLSSCCGSSKSLPNQENQNLLTTQNNAKKKISLATLKNKRSHPEYPKSSTEPVRIEQKAPEQTKTSTVFVNNIVIPPPLVTLTQHHYHTPLQSSIQPRPPSHLLASLRSQNTHPTLHSTRIPFVIKQQFSSRSTVPQSRISQTELILRESQSIFSPHSSNILKAPESLESSKCLFEEFQVRCSESKRLNDSTNDVRVEESQVLIEFFHPKASSLSQNYLRR